MKMKKISLKWRERLRNLCFFDPPLRTSSTHLRPHFSIECIRGSGSLHEKYWGLKFKLPTPWLALARPRSSFPLRHRSLSHHTAPGLSWITPHGSRLLLKPQINTVLFSRESPRGVSVLTELWSNPLCTFLYSQTAMDVSHTRTLNRNLQENKYKIYKIYPNPSFLHKKCNFDELV